MKNHYLINIVGPTAIGKTNLSIRLANHYHCDIISGDSRQFFKEMEIGTAVPEKFELEQAKHHFIQNISIFNNYSVGDFERDALKKLEALFQKKNIAILVGGSGLYVNAVLNGLDNFPSIDPQIRTNLKSDLELKGLPFLQEKLKQLDFDTYQKMDIENPQRLIRALEICIGTKKPYASFLNKNKEKRNFIPIKIGITTDREIIYSRINQRVDVMIAQGLVEEAKKLYPHKNLNALQTVGYKELFEYFDGNCTLDFAISEIKKNTRRFAKRQLTWFKKDTEIQWFDYQENLDNIILFIEQKMKH